MTEYSYWLVRYVPDVARGERVNVALIVGSDSGDWAIRRVPNLRRASRLGGNATAVRPWLDDLASRIHEAQNPPLEVFGRAAEPLTVARFELMAHRFNNVVQLSAGRPVWGESADSIAEALAPVLIDDPSVAARSTTRSGIVAQLSALYTNTLQLEHGRNLFQGVRARVGRQSRRFDLAASHAHRTQLTQAFAFDVRNTSDLERDVQAWNYIVSRLRTEGASLELPGHNVRVTDDTPIAVAYQAAPSPNAQQEDLLGAALEDWSLLGVLATPSSELPRVTDQLMLAE